MIYFKRDYPTPGMPEYLGSVTYFAGQIVQLDSNLEKFFVDNYFADYYNFQNEYFQRYDLITGEDGLISGLMGPNNKLLNVANGEIGGASNKTWRNANPAFLPRWRAALARYNAGTGNAKIACIGDSITLGNGAGTGTANQVNARVKSYPMQLAERLKLIFGPNVDGNHNYNYNNGLQSPLTAADYNPRITLGANWTQLTTAASGSHFQNNTDTVNYLDFAVTKAINKIDIVCRRLTGTNVFTVHLESQGPGTEQTVTVTGDAALGPILQEITFASPSTTTDKIRIRRVSGNVGVAAVTAYNTATPEIQVANWGWNGARATAFADTATTYAFNAAKVAGAPLVLEAHKVDLVLCVIGHNDINASPATNIDSFKTDLQQIINAARQENGTYYGADLIFGTCFPSNRVGDVAGLAPLYNNAIIEVATSNSIPVLDINKRAGTTFAVADKYIPFSDGTHPTAVGYADEAQGFWELIQSAS